MRPRAGQRFFVPEVIQSSGMDCGPACLTALLAGFGIEASYARLREACQTDVDGTSIDAIEDVAVRLGLDAEQVVIPVDHLLVPEAGALPAIVVVRLPNGFAHFVVVWRSQAGRLQLMDPATGRRWTRPGPFLDQVFVHAHQVPAAAWREWAASEGFQAPLSRRIRGLGADAARFVQEASSDPGWRKLAQLDAATRLVASLLAAGAVCRGAEAASLLANLVRSEPTLIPAAYWFAGPATAAEDGTENLTLRGAVLVRALGARPEPARAEGSASPDLDRVRREPRPRPLREVAKLLALDGRGLLGAFALGVLAAATAKVLEVVLFRGLLDLVGDLGSPSQRALVCAMVAILVAIGVGLRDANERVALELGRRVEVRLRVAFLRKLPRLGHRYFRSRPVSDLAERAYNLHRVRQLASALGDGLHSGAQLLITGLAMALLAPSHAVLLLSLTVGAAALPIAALPLIRELDLRMRAHLGVLGRFQLDSSLGLVAVRSHRAERSLRGEQVGFLEEYISTRLSLYRAVLAIELVQGVAVLAGVLWLIVTTAFQEGASGRLLLLAYWGLNLPLQGRGLLHAVQRTTSLRNIVLRVLEPLTAPEEAAEIRPGEAREVTGPAAIDVRAATVVAAGHEILSTIDLRVAAGEHLAIVGPSGSGKSTLVGLFLGRHTAATGEVEVDGAPLAGERLQALRAATAWVDPAVQLWNRSLLENLRYGAPEGAGSDWDRLLDDCELRGLVSILSNGLRTPLGESGGLVSGGEGQRVRLGRAMTRAAPRLVILDEPFRGLARGQRHRLLERCRERWRDVTLLCVTHDIAETLAFDRVAVVEGGRLVESGRPDELAERAGGRFRALLTEERRQQQELWGADRWRTMWMESGRLADRATPGK